MTPKKPSTWGMKSQAITKMTGRNPSDARKNGEKMDEEEVLEMAAEDRGEEFVEENEELILADAKRLNLI